MIYKVVVRILYDSERRRKLRIQSIQLNHE